METYEQLSLNISPSVRCTASDFRASLSRLQEGVEDSEILEALSFLRSCGWLKPESLRYFSARTYEDSLITMEDGRSRPLLEAWTNWGTMSNGSCLIANISESLSQGSECSLSDILESDPPKRFFLSQAAVDRLISYKGTEVL